MASKKGNFFMRKMAKFVSGYFGRSIDEITLSLKFMDTLSDLEQQLHTSDDPKEIARQTMKVACDFYQADWCGFLDVDLDLGLWTPECWYNMCPEDKTTELTDEFESASKLTRWLEAMDENGFIVVSDANETKDSYPDEYAIYQRLSVSSILAVPVKPHPMGFLAIRNPKRFNEDPRLLRMLAYVVQNAISQYIGIERMKMALSPEAIESDNDVIFNFFGDLEIYTSSGVLREQDFQAPISSRIIAYLMLNRRATHNISEIAAALWPEDNTPPDKLSNTIRGAIYRFRKECEVIGKYDLIDSTKNGYRINPKLRIMTDIQQFDKLLDAIHDAPTVFRKVDLMKQAVSIYRGPIFETACDEHWIMSTAHNYNISYIGLINELLSKLAEVGDFAGIQQYASKALEMTPENPNVYYWLVISMCRCNATEMARSELKRAKEVLIDEDYTALIDNLKKGKIEFLPICLIKFNNKAYHFRCKK